jgi:hypothetical protein
MAELLEQALDIALDKKDLKRNRARRLQREAKQSSQTPATKSPPDEIFSREPKAPSRYILPNVRA